MRVLYARTYIQPGTYHSTHFIRSHADQSMQCSATHGEIHKSVVAVMAEVLEYGTPLINSIYYSKKKSCWE